MNKDIQKYLNCMEEIKLRTDVAMLYLQGVKTSGYINTDVEMISLQIRKILELIALSSLAANKEEYSKQFTKFATHWNPKLILQDIERVNPYFYPVPTKQVLDDDSGKVVRTEPLDQDFLKREEFDEIYNMCGGVLHANNPYGEEKNIDEIHKRLPLILIKIVNLLDHHEIQLIDSELQLWVIMKSDDDGRVHYAIMKRVENN
ncbi:hypothetical protein AB4Z30_28465 [Paenibacillus sp. 2TAF8]|uniref:hypothetical protein n=1 Tax=Paenibacillus sp. 2TAF8 TaxID=3233020 RepID=UPI003F9E114C